MPMSYDEIRHYGVKGMKWGIRKDKIYSLMDKMSKVPYVNYTKLKTPEEVLKTGGSCHDQVVLEEKLLKDLGATPKSFFFMEYDKAGQGHTTHSFTTFKNYDSIIMLENAWEENKGVHEYENYSKMFTDISKKFKASEFHTSGTELIFTEFGEHSPGESLQEFVNISLNTREIIIGGNKNGQEQQEEI